MTDEEVLSWIAAGTPPIFFGFGSIPVESPADTIAMIDAACARLGERALVGAAGTDFSNAPHSEHVKVVGLMNYATVFPACRAVVHHGGSSTTPIGMRAGVPQLILFWDLVHAIYGAAVKRLKVGTARRFSTATEESLVADLRTILAPDYVARARELATRITEPATSAAAAADHLEEFAARATGRINCDSDVAATVATHAIPAVRSERPFELLRVLPVTGVTPNLVTGVTRRKYGSTSCFMNVN